MKKGFQHLVDEANAEITTWTTQDAIAAVGNPDIVFIDLCEAHELAETGQVPAAVAAPRGMLEFYADPESPFHMPVFASGKLLLLYCGSSRRSALAAKTLQDMGMTNVAHVAGGFKSWLKANGPVEKPVEK